MTTQVTVSDIPNNVIMSETGVQVVSVSQGLAGKTGGLSLYYEYGTSPTVTQGQIFDDGSNLWVNRYDRNGSSNTTTWTVCVAGTLLEYFSETDPTKYKYIHVTALPSTVGTIEQIPYVLHSTNPGSAFVAGELVGIGVGLVGITLPSQTGNAGDFLKTDGTNLSWGAVSGAVSAVSNSDGTLTISPTTGNVVASLNPSIRGQTLTLDNIYNGTTALGSLEGVSTYVENAGTATVIDMDGDAVVLENKGQVGNLQGSSVNFTNDTGGVVTTYIGYFAVTPGNSGTIANAYGFYAGDHSVSVPGGINIYSAGADSINVFQGSLQMGGVVQPGLLADTAAPDNSLYYSTTQTAISYKDNAGGVHNLQSGGGATNLYGTYSTRPTAGTAGRVYTCSDSPYVSYDDGSQWHSRAYGHLVSEPPAVSSFTWINQHFSSATQNGVICLNVAPHLDNEVSGMYQAAPSTPYKKTMGCLVGMVSNVDTTPSAGMMFYNSSTGGIIVFGVNTSTGNLVETYGVYWSSPTNPVALLFNQQAVLPSGLLWLRIGDDGTTNRTYEMSADGFNWVVCKVESRTNNMTADSVGFYGNCSSDSPAVLLSVVSWSAG